MVESIMTPDLYIFLAKKTQFLTKACEIHGSYMYMYMHMYMKETYCLFAQKVSFSHFP